MKKRFILLLALVGAIVLSGCGDDEEEVSQVVTSEPQIQVINDAPAITIAEEEPVEEAFNPLAIR